MFVFILRTWQHPSPLLASTYTLNRADLFLSYSFLYSVRALSTWFHRALPNITTLIADICNNILSRVALVFAAIFRFFVLMSVFKLRTWQHPSPLLASTYTLNRAALVFIVFFCFFYTSFIHLISSSITEHLDLKSRHTCFYSICLFFLLVYMFIFRT